MEATIKLFKALPVENKNQKTDVELMKRTIRKGFVFAPEVVANYSNYDELIGLVEKTIGLSAEEMNSSFHKSWEKVAEASIEQLFVEQIVHYLTTYGKEAGLIALPNDFIYIPTEKLEIPGITDNIKLVVIKGYTKNELTDKLLELLGSGIALAEDTVKAAVEVAMFVGLEDFERVKNKEVKVALYDYSGLFPKNPVEFLRFAIFKATSTTLLIKSPELISLIKASNNLNIVKLFNDYEKKYGLQQLAEVFYRFKPLWLAFRTNDILKQKVNKIRRLAVKYHKPLPEDYLNTVTAKLSRGEDVGEMRLLNELGKANIFRKIRLAYALKFRTNEDVDSILYRVRNGKGYAKEFDFSFHKDADIVLDRVLDSISKHIIPNVEGKKIYIPEYIHYSLPATEKQFTGNFPSGTYVSLPSHMLVGVHWYNVKGNRVDLDLSMVSAEMGKIGWDGYYRTGDKGILFSGDMTDARGGASELFYVKNQTKTAFILFINYFNFNAAVEVPFKILVAEQVVGNFRKNYTVDPNTVVAISNSVINKPQKILGLLVTTPEENRFYFAEASVGSSITVGNQDYAAQSRKFLLNYYENAINLRDILAKAGAVFTLEKDEADIDLSPEILEKDSFLAILKG